MSPEIQNEINLKPQTTPIAIELIEQLGRRQQAQLLSLFFLSFGQLVLITIMAVKLYSRGCQ